MLPSLLHQIVVLVAFDLVVTLFLLHVFILDT